MAQEKVFFDESGVYVSNTKVVTPIGDTYYLANVTSCKTRWTEHEGTDKKKSNLSAALLWGGIALGIIVAIFIKLVPGIVIAAVGFIASLFINDKFKYKMHHVYLGSASGESQAIESEDEDFIYRIKSAIDQANESRG